MAQDEDPYQRLVEAFERAAAKEEPVVCIGSITDLSSGTLQGVPYLSMALEMVIVVNDRPHLHAVTLYMPPMTIPRHVVVELDNFVRSQVKETPDASH